MKICVTSPVHGQAGNTTVALLISLVLSQNKSVCLTHLSAKSSAFFTYLGLEKMTDIRSTPSQLVKLVRGGELMPQEMEDYCLKVNDKLDIFSNNSASFSDEDMETSARYIMDKMPHDFVVFDVDINTLQPLAGYALKKSDLIIMTMTQMSNVFERYYEVFGRNYGYRDKTLFLCNHYSTEVGSINSFAKTLGVKPTNCCSLPHSETIMRLSNLGKLRDIISEAKSIPLPDVEAGLKRLENAVTERFRKAAERKEK